MTADDAPPTERPHPSPTTFPRDPKGPLTIISGRAQLAARRLRRVSALSEADREPLLRDMACIEQAVHDLVALLDGRQDAKDRRETRPRAHP
jgi:hypothetical protein